MRRKVASSMDGPGQDSFLDIVANLVGILIILVMVIGVNAKDAMLDVAPQEPTPPTPTAAPPTVDVEGARSAAAAVEADIHQIDAKIKRQEFDIAYRRAERERVQLIVQAAEQKLAERREELAEGEREQFDATTSLANAEAELEQIQGQIGSLQVAEVPTAVIEHLPTPMAKTVFGRELHVSLQGGRLSVVPWDELVAQLKEDAPKRVRRLQDRDEITETLGPVAGFWMKYTLVRKRQAVSTRFGVSVQSGVELDHFVLLPVAEGLGEQIEVALAPGSEFRSLLDQHEPGATTVTAWTYPDSYEQFRVLKQTLYKRGYLLASRPLPDGFPIGGSPNGLRSAAQ